MYGIFFTWAPWCAWALPSELFLARIFQTRSGALSTIHMPAPRLASWSSVCWFQWSLYGQLLWLQKEKCDISGGCRQGRLKLGNYRVSFCRELEGLCVCLCGWVVWKSSALWSLKVNSLWGILLPIKVSIFLEFKHFSLLKKKPLFCVQCL